MSRIKDIFPGFYRSKLEKVLSSENSDKTLYVFDTNYFLDIYRFETLIASKFVEAIEQIGDNIFIPFQVGLEFHMNRKNVILERENNRENFKKQISHGFDELVQNINSTGALNFSEKDAFLEEIVTKINNLKKELLENINEKYHNNTKNHNTIEERILSVFEKYMGEEPSEEEEQEYLKDASERYKNKQPPGFDDSHKDSFYYKGRMRERKFGDLLIWKETLKYLESREEIEYVIFISNDGKSNAKTDVRHRVNDTNYDVHISLISEMYYKNGKALYLMGNQEFIEHQIEMTEEDKNRMEEILTKRVSNQNNQTQILNSQLSDNIKLDLINKSLRDQFSNNIDLDLVNRSLRDHLSNITDLDLVNESLRDQLSNITDLDLINRSLRDQISKSINSGRIQGLNNQNYNYDLNENDEEPTDLE